MMVPEIETGTARPAIDELRLEILEKPTPPLPRSASRS
jgi:hypothetical protein